MIFDVVSNVVTWLTVVPATAALVHFTARNSTPAPVDVTPVEPSGAPLADVLAVR